MLHPITTHRPLHIEIFSISGGSILMHMTGTIHVTTSTHYMFNGKDYSLFIFFIPQV